MRMHGIKKDLEAVIKVMENAEKYREPAYAQKQPLGAWTGSSSPCGSKRRWAVTSGQFGPFARGDDVVVPQECT